MLAGLSQFHTAFPAQPSCVDKHQQCPNWAFAGQCELNQGFMKVQCAQSCDSCGWGPELTRTPRGLRWVRTGYAYQSPALGTYRRRRAACPQSLTCYQYWIRIPASGVRYVHVQRTVATQVEIAVDGGWGGWLKRLASIVKALPFR